MNLAIETIQSKVVPILKRNAVLRAGIFGSTARAEAHPNDVDMLVEMPRPYGLFSFLSLKGELEDTLGAKVDLVEYGAIKKSLRERILRDEVRIL